MCILAAVDDAAAVLGHDTLTKYNRIKTRRKSELIYTSMRTRPSSVGVTSTVAARPLPATQTKSELVILFLIYVYMCQLIREKQKQYNND